MEKYQIKSEIEHVLDRSGTYIGSIYPDMVTMPSYRPSINKFVLAQTQYIPGLLKLFDEILSNSIDEHRRSDSLFNVTQIDVKAYTDGTIIIRDNGGIPVSKHKQSGLYIPELIFGHLRTSSNYDDTQDRNVVGTNGLGAKLTNIFSTSFSVTTADGKNQMTIEWSNNMREMQLSEPVKSSEHFTEIKFKIDLNRFELDFLDLNFMLHLCKRCIDGTATNKGLRISFETDCEKANGKLNQTFSYDKFRDYINLYIDENNTDDILELNANKFNLVMQCGVNEFGNIGFVNGALCSEGSHINIIRTQIVQHVLTYCHKNGMELITERDIQNRLTLFVSCTVKNPSYDSQTKTKLTNKLDKYMYMVDDKFLKEIISSSLIKNLADFYEKKYAAEKRKELKKLNAILKATKASTKLIASTGSSQKKELCLFEGTSASAGFRKFRIPTIQSAYLLRGKVRNTYNLDKARIMDNQELREIIALLGLQFEEPQKNIKQLAYDKIIIYSDADLDGGHIAGLILAFFAKHFPELIKAGKIYRAQTPIIVGYNPKTKHKLYFYTEDEFKSYTGDLKGYEIRYTKGLGGLDDNDYSVILRQQRLLKFELKNQEDYDFIQIWFDKDSTQRKQLLLDSQANDD